MIQHLLQWNRLRRIGVAVLLVATALPSRAQEGPESPPPERLSGTLAKVWRTGEMVIGYREGSFPFSYVDGRGVPIGYSIDLCNEIASGVSEELGGRSVAIAYRPVSPATRTAALVDDTIDIECGSTTNSFARRKEVAFSPVIFVAGTKLLVRRSDPYKSLQDLRGKTIVVTAGTTNEAAIRSLSEKQGLGIRVVTEPDHAQSFALLRAGKADAFATDDILLYGFLAKTHSQREFKVVGDYLSYDPYGLMFRKDDLDFSALVQRTFEKLAQSRELLWTYDKWFMRPLPSGERLNVPMSAQLEEIFHTLGLPE
jgi:glutamate/aspartate transport system substrate-binding protein